LPEPGARAAGPRPLRHVNPSRICTRIQLVDGQG
jgi:hypothetical protein